MAMTKEQASEFVKTIVFQLSGATHNGRLAAMLGATNFGYSSTEYYFKFQFKMCKKANLVQIHLNGKDLYDVSFYKINMRKVECPLVEKFNDVYGEDLERIFKSYTGLDTHL